MEAEVNGLNSNPGRVLGSKLSRQQARALLTKAAFWKVPSSVPRPLRREWARVAMKIARRTTAKVWEYPMTRLDLELNNRLRRYGMALDAIIDPYIQPIPRLEEVA